MSFAAHSSALAVVAISVLTSLVSEAVSWFYIYRHASWRSARASLGRATKKVDALRSEVALGEAGTKQKKTSKKVGKAETNLKQTTRELQTLNMRTTGVASLTMMLTFGIVNSVFDGLPVARLPFEPMWMFSHLTHRGLPGDDYTECGWTGLLTLCSMSLRAIIKKALGFTLPRGVQSDSPFAPNGGGFASDAAKAIKAG